MRLMRNRARLIAVMALTWHIMTMAAIVTVLSVELHATMEEAGEENCPLHSKPSCPLHGERHGTHDCDCPTIGCAQTDIGFTGLFGPVGVLPVPVGIPEPIDAGKAAPVMSRSTHLLARLPLAPPPRT
jgi:hypothetical protein